MDLLKQCQTMHSSIGTGSLAYPVGSKVMDMRTSSKDEEEKVAKVERRQASIDDTGKINKYSDLGNNCTDKSDADQRESSSNSPDLISVRGNADTAAYDSCFLTTSGLCGHGSSKIGGDCNGSEFISECNFDFPSLPVIDLFKNTEDEKEFDTNEEYSAQYNLKIEDDNMHSFQISNNADLIMESNLSPSPSKNLSRPCNSEIELVHPDAYEPVLRSNNLSYKTETVNKLRISDIPETPLVNATRSQEGTAHDERVSEWLWTLHRIGNFVTLCCLHCKTFFRFCIALDN